MEPTSLTPFRRDNSMEDRDSSPSRKRPRLDDNGMATSGESEAHQSNVTINLRPQQNGDVSNTLYYAPEPTSDPPNTNGSSPELAATSNPVDLSGGSPETYAGSPVVEIGEPEDIPDDDDVILLDEDEAYRAAVFELFPYAAKYGCRDSAKTIALSLEDGSSISSHVFKDLSTWIRLHLEHTVDVSSQWARVYIDERDFWDEVSIVFSRLVARRTPFGAASSQVPYDYSTISELFGAYVGLCVRLIVVDVEALMERTSRDAAIKPRLICTKHLKVLDLIFRPAMDLPIWSLLTKSYRIDVHRLLSSTMQCFLSMGGTKEVTRLSTFVLKHVPSWPNLSNDLLYATHIVLSVSQYIEDQLPQGELPSQIWKRFPQDVFALFQVIDKPLQENVSKQTSSLHVDLCKELIRLLFQLLYHVAKLDPALVTSLSENYLPSDAWKGNSEHAHLLSNAWKFSLLKRYIAKGRMELRILGIEAMQAYLVDVWSRYCRANPEVGKQHPVVQHLAKFLLDEQLVSYIVGVDSHPQLISRSGNIVGFLAITGKYTHAETDTIWATVANSPDPRTVNATLTMLDEVTKLMETEEITYLCEKLSEMPLQAFTADLLAFGRRVLDQLRNKLGHRPRELGMTPYWLCVRLYQEATAKPGQSDSKDILDFAEQELAVFAGLPGNDENRQAVYLKCAQEVENMTVNATGSILAIHGLLKSHGLDSMHLTKELHLTKLLIKETCLFIDTERNDRAGEPPSVGVTARLELLTYLIYSDPNSIPNNFEETLWEHLVGAAAVNDLARDMAWYKLSELARNLDGNGFVSRCFSVYLQNLEPRFFTKGLFDFVQQATQYLARNASMRTLQDSQTLAIPGAAELWRIILTAPDDTIEVPAIKLFVAMHLETPQVRRAPVPIVEATHVALVDRCFSQIQTASHLLRRGSSDREDTLIDAADQGIDRDSEDKRFRRIIKLLTCLLISVRTRREYNSAPKSPPVSVVGTSEVEDIKGEPVEIKYQTYVGGKQTKMGFLTAGSLETYADFRERLQTMTGFEKFSLIAGGAKLDLKADPTLTLGESKIASKGVLYIMKTPGGGQHHAGSNAQLGCSVIEREILKHFDELYMAMNLDDDLDRAIYQFLLMFPIQNRIQDQVAGENASASALLPTGKKFQAMYCIHALKSHLQGQMRGGALNDGFLASGVRMLVKAIALMPVNQSPQIHTFDLELAVMLVDCLLTFLKERPLHEVASLYFADEVLFVRQLLDILERAQQTQESLGSPQLVQLVIQCYSCIIEASLHSTNVWKAFTSIENTAELHQNLLLVEPRSEIRDKIAKIIEGVCIELPFITEVTAQEFVVFFWNSLSQIMGRSVDYPRQCGSVLALAALVFRANEVVTSDEGALRSCLGSWSDILLNYHFDTPVGRGEVDEVVLGLARLLLCCIQHLKSFKKPLRTGLGTLSALSPQKRITDMLRHLMDNLFTTLLFPPGSETRMDSSPRCSVQLPVLDSQARKEVYEIVLALCEDIESYRRLLELVEALLPSENGDTNTWNIDRTRVIRASTGYVGLRNLSNTCYMNSLLTQLFMNLDFRKFMLNVHIADGDGSQKLLAETQRLFAYMQDSYEKFVNTEGFADQIRTYDGEHIDPAVQMDVDEFYNLLFDRWEGQMLTPDAKETFRSFYGGQSITQIKSKECEHVSERLETFFTIQCEVKGKQTLEDSLKAYVEGDVMEGDNKYKCEKCGGRFVDAVKRSCLKEIPDNLIFHLKRFDFDLVTLQRSKINDHFSFPYQIDMSPYKVDTLNNPDQPAKEDPFDLVGILVHTGTAESGHYYSYIRFRPAADGSPTWFEFNDVDVNYFDPQRIEDSCFGGLGEPTYLGFDKVQLPKAWNAYMLFYQRSPGMGLQRPASSGPTQRIDARVEVPDYVKQRIEHDNEWIIRRYCLFDASHASFVRSLLQQLQKLNNGICSEDHDLERRVIYIALEHVVQVVSRLKDTLELEQLCSAIKRTTEGCSKCCAIALERLASHPAAMRNLLIRSPAAKVRQVFAELIYGLLLSLRAKGSPSLYGLDTDDISHGATADGAFPMIARKLRELLPLLGSARNAWDDFFHLLRSLAHLGTAEVGVLLSGGALTACLDILVIEHDDTAKQRFPSIAKMMEKKKPSHNNLIMFMTVLLNKINLEFPRVDDEEERVPDLDEEKFPLSHEEHELMTLWEKKDSSIVFLQRMIDVWEIRGRNTSWLPGLVMRQILLAEPDFGLFKYMAIMIRDTIDAWQAAYLEPALLAARVFCEFTPGAAEAGNIIAAVARSTNSLEAEAGEAYATFFASVMEMVNPRLQDLKPDTYYAMCVRQVPYWAPNLLLYRDRGDVDVQGVVLDILKTHVFGKGWLREEGESEGTEFIRANAVRYLFRKSMEKLRQAFESELSRTFVEPLMTCVVECEKWIRGMGEEEDERVLELRSPDDEKLLRAYDAFTMDLRNWNAEDEDALASDAADEWQSDFDSDEDIIQD